MARSIPKHVKTLVPYMREHSVNIHTMPRGGHHNLNEDPILSHDNIKRPLIVITCRTRQRKLQHAWSRWTKHTGVIHDYLADVITILSRPLAATELRTELEVEVIFKWVLQDYALDPTGIAYTLYMCMSKRSIVGLIQRARLDRYQPGEAIVLQNAVPLPEEGLFTILNGKVDIVILPRETDQLMRLHRASKANDNTEIHAILTSDGILADTLQVGAGFGELSAKTKVRRGASVVAADGSTCYSTNTVDTLVVTSEDLVSCLDKRRTHHNQASQVASAEVMDFLRQTGLVHQASMADIMQAAASITKKTYPAGTLLYRKGDPVDKAFIILSGEIFLDVGNFTESMDYEGHFFQNANPNNCYTLASGSILGDEGMIGLNRTYDASAVVLSEVSMVFEIEGFAIHFLGGRLGVEKYSALLYKDKSIECEACDYVLGEIVIHSIFNSLRKVISSQNPYRQISRPVYIWPKKTEKKRQVKKPKQSTRRPKADASDAALENTVDEGKDARTSGAGTGTGEGKSPVVARARKDEDGHIVLSSGGLHHLHFIRRGVKHREAMAMHEVAQRTVLHNDRMKRAANRPISSGLNSSQQTKDKVSHDKVSHEYSNLEQYKDSEKFRRARADYLRRKDLEFGEHLLKLENEELSLLQESMESSDGPEREDLFVQATTRAMGDMDAMSVGSSLRRFSTREIGQVHFSKLEQYYLALAQAPPSPVPVQTASYATGVSRRLSRQPSRGASPPRRPSVSPLTMQNLKSRPTMASSSRISQVVENPSALSSPTVAATAPAASVPIVTGEPFYRMATTRTVGVAREDDSAKYNRNRKRSTLLRTSSSLQTPIPLNFPHSSMKDLMANNNNTKQKQKPESEYDQKLRKFLDIAQDHTKSRDELNRGVYGNSSQKSVGSPHRATVSAGSGRKFLEVHQRQQSLKSDTRETNGKVLLRKASLALEGTEEKTKHSITDFAFDKDGSCLKMDDTPKPKLVIKSWDLTGNDITEAKYKAIERAKVLQTWQEMVDREPPQSSFQNGRRKSVATSVHRNNTERDRIKDEAEIVKLSLPGVTQDMKDLLRWKQYCAQDVLHTKHGPLRSMPTLAKQGAKAYLGRKMVTNTNVLDRPHTAA